MFFTSTLHNISVYIFREETTCKHGKTTILFQFDKIKSIREQQSPYTMKNYNNITVLSFIPQCS